MRPGRVAQASGVMMAIADAMHSNLTDVKPNGHQVAIKSYQKLSKGTLELKSMLVGDW
jgi:hypothetical protein